MMGRTNLMEGVMFGRLSWVLVAVAPFAIADAAAAQQTAAQAAEAVQPIKRIPLPRFEVPETGYETIIGLAEILPDVNVGRHTHPGPESGYVIEGNFELLVDGKDPVMMSTGESYLVPAGVAHDARSGAEGAKVIATYLIPAGQPIATPVN